MEMLKRIGGSSGALMAIAGGGVLYLAPQFSRWGWGVLVAGLLLVAAAAWLNRDDLLNVLKGRPFRHGTNALFYTLLVLGITAMVVFLAGRHNKRFDLTEGGQHTLSPQTLQLVKGLDQDVSITAFYSPASSGRQRAVDLLEEYDYLSDHLTYRMVDPDRSPGEAKAFGIDAYGTTVIASKAGEARLTTVPLTEQDLTNALIKATAKSRKTICLTTGHGERGMASAEADGFQQASEALKKENFDLREVRLLESGATLADCSSVIVAGPSHAMLPPEVEAISGYVAGGGRLLVLKEPRLATGLEPLLARYGLKAADDLIVDVNPLARMLGGSPDMPVVYQYGAHAITKGMEGVATVFPTVGSIETVTPAESGVTTEMLASSSDQSWGETGDLREKVSFDSATEKAGPLGIAALAVRKDPAAPAAEPVDPNSTAAADAGPKGKEARVVVFGDADYAANATFMTAANKDLFLNTMAWLNERADLIAIRPKEHSSQPVILTLLQARALGIYALGICPLALAAAGLGVYLRRRRL